MEEAVASPHKSRIRRENLKKILKAAEYVFAEAGFSGATMTEIAQRAKLPKANLHYYFGTKEDLYRAVLDAILEEWVDSMAAFEPNADPKIAVSSYVRAKMEFSRARPQASKVFANEVIHGAPILADFLTGIVRQELADKAAVVEGWAADGKISAVDGRHFFFMVWALTQHYADFEVQVRAALSRSRLSREDWDHAIGQVETFVLRALGLG